jgi:hypothetical protein
VDVPLLVYQTYGAIRKRVLEGSNNGRAIAQNSVQAFFAMKLKIEIVGKVSNIVQSKSGWQGNLHETTPWCLES